MILNEINDLIEELKLSNKEIRRLKKIENVRVKQIFSPNNIRQTYTPGKYSQAQVTPPSSMSFKTKPSDSNSFKLQPTSNSITPNTAPTKEFAVQKPLENTKQTSNIDTGIEPTSNVRIQNPKLIEIDNEKFNTTLNRVKTKLRNDGFKASWGLGRSKKTIDAGQLQKRLDANQYGTDRLGQIRRAKDEALMRGINYGRASKTGVLTAGVLGAGYGYNKLTSKDENK